MLALSAAEQISYTLIEGSPERPVLVFLHEGLGCTRMWRDFPHQLCQATGLSGLIYDRLGYGRSSPLSKPRSIHYLHAYAQGELPQVVERIIPNRDYFLIGHSDGGSIALIHAADRPARLRGVVTEAAHVFVEEESLTGIRAAVAAFRGGRLRGLARYHGDKTDQVFGAWADTWLSAAFSGWNIEALLPLITCPVLVLQGTEDQYGTMAQVEAIAARVPNARTMLIEGCGHAPHLEQPAIVLALLQEFLTCF